MLIITIINNICLINNSFHFIVNCLFLFLFIFTDNQLSCQNLCWSLDLPLDKLSYPFTYEETDCYLHNGNMTKLINSDEEICNFNHDKLIDIITQTTANLQIIT